MNKTKRQSINLESLREYISNNSDVMNITTEFGNKLKINRNRTGKIKPPILLSTGFENTSNGLSNFVKRNIEEIESKFSLDNKTTDGKLLSKYGIYYLYKAEKYGPINFNALKYKGNRYFFMKEVSFKLITSLVRFMEPFNDRENDTDIIPSYLIEILNDNGLITGRDEGAPDSTIDAYHRERLSREIKDTMSKIKENKVLTKSKKDTNTVEKICHYDNSEYKFRFKLSKELVEDLIVAFKENLEFTGDDKDLVLTSRINLFIRDFVLDKGENISIQSAHLISKFILEGEYGIDPKDYIKDNPGIVSSGTRTTLHGFKVSDKIKNKNSDNNGEYYHLESAEGRINAMNLLKDNIIDTGNEKDVVYINDVIIELMRRLDKDPNEATDVKKFLTGFKAIARTLGYKTRYRERVDTSPTLDFFKDKKVVNTITGIRLKDGFISEDIVRVREKFIEEGKKAIDKRLRNLKKGNVKPKKEVSETDIQSKPINDITDDKEIHEISSEEIKFEKEAPQDKYSRIKNYLEEYFEDQMNEGNGKFLKVTLDNDGTINARWYDNKIKDIVEISDHIEL